LNDHDPEKIPKLTLRKRDKSDATPLKNLITLLGTEEHIYLAGHREEL